MKVEVLVAAMKQKDLSLYEKMNLHCDAVIANQCGEWKYEEAQYEYGKVRMISSDTRGVGINRNLALELAEGEILLFADDDLVYYDSDLQGVIDAFRHFPDADVIFFGLDMTRGGKVCETFRCKSGRRRLWNSLSFGTCRMAIKKQALQKHMLSFSTLFGGGAIYGSGEDSLFIRDCFRAGLKVYSYDYMLGTCACDESSWFTGFNEKYMFDKGAWIACAFPRMKHIVKWYFVRKDAKKAGFSRQKTVKLMNRGIAAFRELKPFEADRSLQ